MSEPNHRRVGDVAIAWYLGKGNPARKWEDTVSFSGSPTFTGCAARVGENSNGVFMSSFDARLHVPGRSRIPIAVEIDIADERMTLTSGSKELGAWPLRNIMVTSLSDGFHLELEGEEVVLNVAESQRFVSELGTVVKRSPAASSSSVRGNGVSPEDATTAELRALEREVSEVAKILVSEDIEPARAFGTWLKLLKEVNRRHRQGSLSTPMFHQLNTQLLDLFPEPATDQPLA